MTTGKAWVTVENGTTVNFRQKESTASAKVVGMPTIKKGEEVMITSGNQTWAAVEYKGYNGYIMLKYLTQDEPVQNEINTPARSADVIVSEITDLLSELVAMTK